MISDKAIKNRIYEEFIKPTINNESKYIGIEIELPILNLNKEAVDFKIVHEITEKFLQNFSNFRIKEKDYDGNIQAIENTQNHDVISYDCSYNNLELALGKEKDLFEINKRFCKYYRYFNKEFKKYNHTLTGMGINPHYNINNNVPIPTERYLMLYNHLKSYENYEDFKMYFHDYPEYGMFSSASQIQLDVNYDDLIQTIDVFTKLEPIKALLFSNSVFPNQSNDTLCNRDRLWEKSLHGRNPHNVGMYETCFESVEDLENYFLTLDMYCVMRNGIYINFTPLNIIDYFKQEKIIGQYYDGGEYKEIEFVPNLDDISFLRPFKFLNLTFRGTIEHRSICTQPVKDSMCVGAFHIGLNEKLDELQEILNNDTVIYHHGYNPSELRKFLIKNTLPSFINEKKLYELAKEIVNLAYQGLIERNKGEEIFLQPLYSRIENKTNPGKELLNLNTPQQIKSAILEYSKLQ